jgi:hypothetical protein
MISRRSAFVIALTIVIVSGSSAALVQAAGSPPPRPASGDVLAEADETVELVVEGEGVGTTGVGLIHGQRSVRSQHP